MPRCTAASPACRTTSPKNEVDAIRLGREIVAHLNWRKLGASHRYSPSAGSQKYDPDELLGIGSIDVRQAVRRSRSDRAYRRRLVFRGVQDALTARH